MTEKRFRVINYSDGSGMYGVSDRIGEITVAWDKSKLIMDNLCDLLNHLYEENIQLKNELQFRNCVGKSAQILTRSDWEDLDD